MKFKYFKRDLTAFLDKETQKAVGRYWEVYVYNAEEVTHCCEITPSYTCFPVTFETENEINDELYDRLQEGMAILPGYFHCFSIDPIAKDCPPPPDRWEDDTDEEYLEGCLEYYQANCGVLA